MLKRAFLLISRLMMEPNKTWTELSESKEKDNEDFYKSYLYPIFGIIALFSFVGILIGDKPEFLQTALKAVIKQLSVYMGGFYLASYIMSDYVYPKFKQEKNKLLCEKFVGYSSALVFAVAMVQSLFPSLFFLQILALYSVYLIWVGAIHYIKVDENNWVKFTIHSSFIVLLSPMLILLLIGLLFPNM